jgi:hypothetical protein
METVEFILRIAVPATIGVYLVARGLGYEPSTMVRNAEDQIKAGAAVALIYCGVM